MSGLQHSQRIAALNGQYDAPAIATYSTSTMPSLSRRATRSKPESCGFHFFLSLLTLVICGPLLLQTLIPLMSSFSLWPISQTTLIN
jgi:hypothetical protein